MVSAVRRWAWRFLQLDRAFRVSQLETCLRAHGFRLRPDTGDREIFEEVVLQNLYRLPERLGAEDVVVDIGAHIGCFSYAALVRGAGRVYACEAEHGNYEAAAGNLQLFGERVRVRHQAVWRSDRPGDPLFEPWSPDPGNSGGASLLWLGDGRRVEAVALDDLLREATDEGRRRVRLVKIDCEGSEFPILLTSKLLHLIDGICGEYHEISDGVYNHQPIPDVARVAGTDRFTVAALTHRLQEFGFAVESQRSGQTNLGVFFATRQAGAADGRCTAAA
jgi:FkbM family methyltransferase